jgi:hypothetical protein
MMRGTRQGQRGYILIAVAVIGTVATMVMSSVFNGGVIQEQRAVSERLAEMRTYWAIMGHFHYGLSRIRQARLCDDSGGSCDPNSSVQDTAMAAVLRGYFSEINSYRRFTYPEESTTNYWIDIDRTALVDPNPARHNHSEHLWLRSSIPNTQSTLPALSGLRTRFRPLEMRICVNMTTQATPCGNIGSNNFGGNLNGLYRVRTLFRI